MTAVFAFSSTYLTRYGPSAIGASLCRESLSLFFSERKKTKSPCEIFSELRRNSVATPSQLRRNSVATSYHSCVYIALGQSVSVPLLRAALWKASISIFLGRYEPSMARSFALVQKAVLVVSITPVRMARMLSTSAVASCTRM